MEGAAPNLEKLYEQKITKKLSHSMQALLGLHKNRDRQLVGLMNKAVIPPLLVQAKNWYEYRMKNAKSERFRETLTEIYESMISPLVDLFTPYPIPIETLLKDQATDQGEINVFGAPERRKKRVYDDDAAQAEKDYDLDKLEEKMKEELEVSFRGPEDKTDEKSPFLSFREDEDIE